MRLALLLALLPGAAAAHPHVFVESRVELVLDGPTLVAVRLTWTYDEFFSLMLTQELGLDPEADGVLTDAEAAALAASVADWPADFTGDLVVSADGEPLALAPRREHAVAMDGTRIVESHTRPLAAPVPVGGGITVENFDPYYYVAYAVSPEVAVAGAAGCQATVIPADVVTGQAKVDELYGALDVAGAGPEVQLPPVGFAFADRIELRCAP